jgi:hypothetical protein
MSSNAFLIHKLQQRLVTIHATGHVGHNTKNEAVLLLVLQAQPL